jgi:hypothetical protein
MKVLLALAGVALFRAPGGAQAPVPVPSPVTSEIAGVIEDPSGAVVPGVQVTAINLATNVRRSATTDATGRFVVSGLPVGAYRVEVTASGFATLRVENVRVEPGRSTSLRLRLGGGPVPVPSPGGGSQDEGASVVEWNVSDANSLEQRLATKAEDGFELQAVVPTVSGKSLFVFGRAGSAAGAGYVVVALKAKLAPEPLRKAVAAQNGDRLVGVHTLAAASHLLVFRHGR